MARKVPWFVPMNRVKIPSAPVHEKMLIAVDGMFS